MSQVSTVPKSSRPSSAFLRAPSTLSRIHFILVAEKYASKTRPVFCLKKSAYPPSRKESQYSEVRRHCHTMALYTGSPVSLSHTTDVSRWFVIPIAEISDADAPIFAIASTATLSCVDHISFALCSTHPACGKYCLNSFCARLQMRLCLSKSMHLQLVVPASRAII